MQRALLTGATGFVGNYVLNALLADGFEVRCLVRNLERSQSLKRQGVERFVGDLSRPETLKDVVKDLDLVVHLGGLMTALTSNEFERVNGQGTQHLVAACAELESPPVFILISSIAAAGTSGDHLRNEMDPVHPISHYGRSKRTGELAAAAAADRVPVTIMRPPFVFGGGDRSGFYIFRPVKRFGIHPVPGMRHRRKISLIHAEDLATSILLAAHGGTRVDATDANRSSFSQGCYFVADDATPLYSDLGDMIGAAVGRASVVKLPVPDTLARTLGGIATMVSKLRGRPGVFSLDKAREGAAGSWTCSTEKIKQELHFKTSVSLEDRLQATVDWYLEHRWF